MVRFDTQFQQKGQSFDLTFCEGSASFDSSFGKVIEVESRGTEVFSGDYTVSPKANEQTVLQTKNKKMNDDVVVLQVPYYETSNVSGETVYIASGV